MENLKRLIAAYNEAAEALRGEMGKLHDLKMQYRGTGLGEAEVAEQTTATEAARQKFDRAYANYLALYRAME